MRLGPPFRWKVESVISITFGDMWVWFVDMWIWFVDMLLIGRVGAVSFTFRVHLGPFELVFEMELGFHF